MRTRIGTILIAVVALAVGAAAGWFAAGARGKNKCENVEVCKYGNMKTANDGSAGTTKGGARSMNAPKEKVEPRRTAKVNAEKRREQEAVKPVEEPAQDAQAETQKKDDNPFTRYLDMFRNDPEALAAEFIKEAEADNAKQRKMREDAIAKMKLNAKQAELFEKALDDLRDEITRQSEEWVRLINSGQMNEDTAADGRFWDSNPLLCERVISDREAAVRETAEKLYEQLVTDGISDAAFQRVINNAAQKTAFAYECLEPNLAVYDKVYKNMGVGDGIFSWCRRQQQNGKK